MSITEATIPSVSGGKHCGESDTTQPSQNVTGVVGDEL